MFEFNTDRCLIKNPRGHLLTTAPCKGNAIYYLVGWSPLPPEPTPQSACFAASSPVSALAARSPQSLRNSGTNALGTWAMTTSLCSSPPAWSPASTPPPKSSRRGAEGGLCEPCALGKQHRSPSSPQASTATGPAPATHGPVRPTAGHLQRRQQLLPHAAGRPLQAVIVTPWHASLTPLRQSSPPSPFWRTRPTCAAQRLRCDNGTEFINQT